MNHASVNQIVVDIMVVFMLLGAVDKCIGGRMKLGPLFDEGIGAMKELTLNMVGIICLAPVLGRLLMPAVGPVYRFLGADPAMFAGTLLANDMGGYSLAKQMADTPAAADLGGLLLGSLLGASIVFIIPVGLSMIDKRDAPAFATGMLCSIIAMPFGCFAGGLVAGFAPLMVLQNLVPVLLVSALIALGLWRIPGGMIKGFTIVGKGIRILATAGLALGVAEYLTGIVVIPGMDPVTEGLEVVGQIAIVLAGAFVLVRCITVVFKKPLEALGGKMGIGGTAVAGMLASTANSMALYPLIKDMDERGKVVSVAFGGAAASMLGDHIGFTAAAAPYLIAPMLVSKLVAAVLGMLIALVLSSPRFVGGRKKNGVPC